MIQIIRVEEEVPVAYSGDNIKLRLKGVEEEVRGEKPPVLPSPLLHPCAYNEPLRAGYLSRLCPLRPLFTLQHEPDIRRPDSSSGAQVHHLCWLQCRPSHPHCGGGGPDSCKWPCYCACRHPELWARWSMDNLGTAVAIQCTLAKKRHLSVYSGAPL